MNMRLSRIVLWIGIGTVIRLPGQAAPDVSGWSVQADDLRNRSDGTAAELLAELPGLNLWHTGIPGQWFALGIRGQDANRTRILLDGVPIEDPWTGYPDLNWIPSEWLDSVRVHAGPAPFSASFGGRIFLKTRGDEINRPSTRFAYCQGENDLNRLDVSFVQPLGQKTKFIFGATHGGFGKQLPDRESDLTAFRTKIIFRPRTDWKFCYTILSNRQDAALPFSSVLPGDTAGLNSVRRETGRMDHAFQISGSFGKLSNEWTVHCASLDYTLQTDSDRRTFPVRTCDARIEQSLMRSTVPLSWGLFFNRNELRAVQSENARQNILEGFIQADFPLCKRLILSARITPYFSGYGNDLNGSLRMTSRLSPSLICKIQAAKGTQTPTLGETTGLLHRPIPRMPMHSIFPFGSVLTNPALRCETDWSVESGFDYRPNGKIRADFSAFTGRIQDAIGRQSTPDGFQFVNSGIVRFGGTESVLEWHPFSGWEAEGVLNTVQSVDGRNQSLYDRPAFWGNVGVTGKQSLFQNDLVFIFGIRCRFSDGYWLPDVNGPAFWIPARTLLDVKCTAVVMQRARLFVSMDNCLRQKACISDFLYYPENFIQMGATWELFN